ncbi:MAG TPA: fumarate reductase subunit C [Candidatus Latescibacteria bacterium]|jgi:fumarate reductase subunit C|nr:fumarate reductase subunit C [Gemmatimonadaceae bacterium]MDP6015308.1 fumarate reductase subunit C [Candidatus Latescibacterota bacterium]HJP32020.1 fumarate reductase subunit C [Candidatus Latescibacterota bacterium]|tara:strand:- start:162 stop:566 length:405 start_codon:yes stop_codon:yes gene_type:complete
MAYTLYHPKWHRDAKPIFWWVRRWVYIGFIFRELTSVAIAYCAILLMFLYWGLHSGPETYAKLMSCLTHPLMITLNVFALFAVLYHSITWFNLSPKAMVFRFGKWRVPDLMVAGGNYAGWFVVSAVIAWAYVTG